MSTNPHILLAEDEPALGLIVKESLESRGFRVTLCPDGEAAWEGYMQHGPELLVLDVMMPKKDGFSVAKEVRMQDQQIPILFLTAKSQPADVVEGFTLGGDDYHLGIQSAAIDRGPGCGIDADIDGNRRPNGSGYDLGADEIFYLLIPLVLRGQGTVTP